MKTRTPRRVITVLTSDLMTARARAIKCIFVRSDTAPATRHTSTEAMQPGGVTFGKGFKEIAVVSLTVPRI